MVFRAFWRAFREGMRRGKDQAAVEEAQRNLEDLDLQPKLARIHTLDAEGHGRPHLEVAPEDDALEDETLEPEDTP